VRGAPEQAWRFPSVAEHVGSNLVPAFSLSLSLHSGRRRRLEQTHRCSPFVAGLLWPVVRLLTWNGGKQASRKLKLATEVPRTIAAAGGGRQRVGALMVDFVCSIC